MPATDPERDRADVLAAAETCTAAFGRHDRDGYFACFTADATFIFHTTSRVLESRAAWEAEWDRLVTEESFRVLACTPHDQRVQLLGDVALFTHRIVTRVRTNSGEEETDERETIVFRRQSEGGWLAVHEHLSATPA